MKDDTTISAPASAGGKLRLSDVVRALRAGDVELDCKAVLLAVNEDGVTAAFDVDQVQANSRIDVGFLNMFVGVQALVSEYMDYKPEAHAAVAAAYARERRRIIWEASVEDAAEVEAKAKAEAVDGKEVCHD